MNCRVLDAAGISRSNSARRCPTCGTEQLHESFSDFPEATRDQLKAAVKEYQDNIRHYTISIRPDIGLTQYPILVVEGNSGTGKTKAAIEIFKILSDLGVLSGGGVKMVYRCDLVGDVMGEF